MDRQSVARYRNQIAAVARAAYGEPLPDVPRAGRYSHLVWGAALGLPALLGSEIIFPYTSHAGNVVYHLTGFLGTACFRAADLVSTYTALREMDDTRFTDYGLGAIYMETNPLGPRRLAEFARPRLLATEAGVLAVGTAYPPFGHAFAPLAPVAFRINMNTTRRIRLAKNLGDGVYGMLERGDERHDIETYLEHLRGHADEARARFG